MKKFPGLDIKQLTLQSPLLPVLTLHGEHSPQVSLPCHLPACPHSLPSVLSWETQEPQ